LEHRATTIRAAVFCCAVGIAITALHTWGLWTVAVSAPLNETRVVNTPAGVILNTVPQPPAPPPSVVP
jgi:hypothetical protein